MKIYALKDKACGIIHVFTATNDIASKRAMSEMMMRAPDELPSRYSDDFDLLNLGELDTDTGVITQPKVNYVANLTELKRKD